MALKQRFQQLFIGSRDLGLKFANYETSHVDESIDIMLAIDLLPKWKNAGKSSDDRYWYFSTVTETINHSIINLIKTVDTITETFWDYKSFDIRIQYVKPVAPPLQGSGRRGFRRGAGGAASGGDAAAMAAGVDQDAAEHGGSSAGPQRGVAVGLRSWLRYPLPSGKLAVTNIIMENPHLLIGKSTN